MNAETLDLQERVERLRAIKSSLEEAAADLEPISSAEMQAHFEQRIAELQAKRSGV